MSIVPLIPDGPRRTVVDSATEFQARGGLDGSAVLIRGLDKQQLLSANDANITYDLRVGPEYRDHRDASKYDLPDGEEIKLLPGMAVIVKTEEEVHMPKGTFGVIVPKVSLLHSGVSNTGSKVDPGYHGHLLITVFNLGKRTFHLRRHQPFCSMYILQIANGGRPYDKSPKEIPGQAVTGFWRRLRDHVEASHTFWLAGLTLVTLVVAIIQILQLTGIW